MTKKRVLMDSKRKISLCCIVFLFFVSSATVFSQDRIFKKTGEVIDCDITKVDTVRILYSYFFDKVLVNAEIAVSDVEKIDIGVKELTQKLRREEGAFTFGILQGGGGIVGIEIESLISKYVGVHIGAGVVSFGGGLDVHFKPTAQSSYVSLQYWHQGFKEDFVQSLLGPSFVWRSKFGLTAQIGIGFTVDRSRLGIATVGDNFGMLTYAIGYYVPW